MSGTTITNPEDLGLVPLLAGHPVTIERKDNVTIVSGVSTSMPSWFDVMVTRVHITRAIKSLRRLDDFLRAHSHQDVDQPTLASDCIDELEVALSALDGRTGS